MGKRLTAEFGDVIGWRGLNVVALDGLTIKEVTNIEGYSMAESKSSLEGEGRGEFKARND